MLARPEIGSREHIILWLAIQPADETFPWNKADDCVCDRYYRVCPWPLMLAACCSTVLSAVFSTEGPLYKDGAQCQAADEPKPAAEIGTAAVERTTTDPPAVPVTSVAHTEFTMYFDMKMRSLRISNCCITNFVTAMSRFTAASALRRT